MEGSTEDLICIKAAVFTEQNCSIFSTLAVNSEGQEFETHVLGVAFTSLYMSEDSRMATHWFGRTNESILTANSFTVSSAI